LLRILPQPILDQPVHRPLWKRPVRCSFAGHPLHQQLDPLVDVADPPDMETSRPYRLDDLLLQHQVLDVGRRHHHPLLARQSSFPAQVVEPFDLAHHAPDRLHLAVLTRRSRRFPGSAAHRRGPTARPPTGRCRRGPPYVPALGRACADAYAARVFPGGLRAMAYCQPQCVRPGGVVTVHLSATRATVSMEVVRDGFEPEVVWRAADVTAAALPIPEDAPETGCGWPVAVTVSVGASWRSGVYLVRLAPAGAAEAEPPTALFVGRAATPAPGALPPVLPPTTRNAPHDAGGRNFYTGAVALSFERPLCAGMLAKPAGAGERVATLDAGAGPAAFMQYTARHGLAMWHGMAGWAAWERRFLRWAEAAGYRIDVATSLDLDRDPELFAPYRLYLSVGHDEYWSAGLRDDVEPFVAPPGDAALPPPP